MAKNLNITLTGLSLAALLSVAGIQNANAVVYCKTAGVPQGCVVNPYAPAARAAVATPYVGTPYVGTPYVAGPGVGAPGVGVRAGTPLNRGGPVNRVGVR